MKSIQNKSWAGVAIVSVIFLLWRLSLVIFSLLAYNLIEFHAGFPYIKETLIASYLPQWVWHWGNFDGVHYLTIAQYGYAGLVNNEQVFFPLFPVLINLFTRLTGNLFISGLYISNLAIYFAAIIIFKLVKQDFNFKTAVWAVLFLFLFPTSFFFGSIYSESLFLLIVLSAFYSKGIVSIIFSYLAGLTRLVGGFIGIFGILGVATYMAYLKINFDNPLLFLFNQGGFNNARVNSLFQIVTPPQVIFRYLKILLTVNPNNWAFWVSTLELSAFIFGISILLWLTLKKKIKFTYLVYSWLSLFLPVFTGTLLSIPRFLLTIFPIFIGLAILPNKYLKVVIIVGFAILEVILSVLFTKGYFVA